MDIIIVAYRSKEWDSERESIYFYVVLSKTEPVIRDNNFSSERYGFLEMRSP